MPTLPTYTDDGGTVHTEGDLVYDYYSMEPVVIGPACGDGWFNSLKPGNDSWTVGMLNGQRICSLAHARRMGWRDVPTTSGS